MRIWRENGADPSAIPEMVDLESSDDEKNIKPTGGAGVATEEKKQAAPRRQMQRSRSRSGSGGRKFYRPRAASVCDYASDEEVDDQELGAEID